MDKRGLSAIIVTVILVALVLVATAVVWGVINNILKSSSEDISSGFGQLFLDLEIKKVTVEDNGDLSVQVGRGTGNSETEVSGVVFLISDGKNSDKIEKESSLGVLETKTFTITQDELGDVAFVKEVSIAPVAGGKTGSIVDTFELEWIMVVFDNGESGEGWSNIEITFNDGSNIHGIWGNSPNQVSKTFDLSSIPHSQMKIEATYYAIDSWDTGEEASLYVDGIKKWSKVRPNAYSCSGWTEYTSGPAPWGGVRCKDDFNIAPFSHTADSVEISFRTTINQLEGDESWGFDNLAIYVK